MTMEGGSMTMGGGRKHDDSLSAEHEQRYERILKGVVASVSVLAVLLVLYRLQWSALLVHEHVHRYVM